ncbi:MAG: hypothetical protein JO069_07050 [Verrucomicrobia bacterium]|nr:hypothetical protein [Verrucomicrobiota bacterium]
MNSSLQRAATCASAQKRIIRGRWTGVVTRALAVVGRHPLLVLIPPSLWFICRYLPFWKDVDALNALVAAFSSDNLLLCPPLYCILGRVPFWLTDTLLHGTAPGVLAPQHPSLAAVYALVLCQHALLWAGMRYFVFSLPAPDAGRGVASLMLASVASFYSFAHTCGAEATVPITWFIIFGVGLRALYRRTSWKTWTVYGGVLVISIGSRHVSALLLGWLPVTAAILAFCHWRSDEIGRLGAARRALGIAGVAVVLSGASLLVEQWMVAWLCARFEVTMRATRGRTLGDRVRSFLDRLPAAEQRRVGERVAATVHENDPQRQVAVRHAVEALATVGTYNLGTAQVITDELARRGFSGEALSIERDRIILDATMAYYRALDPRLASAILRDIGKGFYPTNDQGIAMTGAKATFDSIALIGERPDFWAGIRNLPMFNPTAALAARDRGFHDNFIRHWRFLPLGAWVALFFAIGGVRIARRRLPLDLALVGLTMFGMGLATYAANCLFIYSMPRYVLPLLIGVFACGAVLAAASHRGHSVKPRPQRSTTGTT